MTKPIFIVDPRVDWENLSKNEAAIPILEQNLDKVDWEELSKNKAAIHILEKNLDKVDWEELSMNEAAIHILEKHLDKVSWYWLSSNEAAIHLIEKLDYQQMFVNNQMFKQELIAFVCNPTWIQKCASRLDMNFGDYQDLLMECNVF